MKIAQIIPAFGLAGAEIMCENLIYELSELGHTVIVISMYDYHSSITERLEKKGFIIRYLNKKSGFDVSMIWKIMSIVKREEIEVVHSHLYAVKYAMLAAILAGVTCRVHTIHNVAEKENGKLSREINKILFRRFRVIPVALSALIRDTVVNVYRIEKDRVPVVLNGIDFSKCLPKEDYERNGVFKILHIGRFSEQKNHNGLLRAYKLFYERYPDSELWLIGEGELKESCEKFVRENNLENNVRFLGLQTNVYAFLNSADMFTLPSVYEGVPMTLIEAMGTGLPIVATAVGGVPDMLEDGENALLAGNNPEEISSLFERYYSDAFLRKIHGKKVRLAAERFSASRMAKEYEGVYTSCKEQ